MKILLTGFEPFGGETINPSWEAVRIVADKINGHQVIKLLLPCVFFKAGEVLEQAIQAHKPDFIFCIGQAGGRADLTVEKVGINLCDGRIADNRGYQPVDVTIHEDGDRAYFSSLPVKAMVRAIRDVGIPASLSYSAGTYVCNYILYETLYLIDKKYPNIKGGFMHIPFAPQQAVGKSQSTPTMSIETIAKGIEGGIAAIFNHEKDINVSEGKTH